MVTQAEVARDAGVDLSTVNRILNRRSAHAFREQTVRKVLSAARRLGFRFGRLRHFHRRRVERVPVTIDCKLSIYRQDLTLFDEGRCVLKDLSPLGAFVADVSLAREAFPTGVTRVVITPLDGPLGGLDLRGLIVRFYARKPTGYGVEFVKLPEVVRKKVSRLCSSGIGLQQTRDIRAGRTHRVEI